MANLLHIFSDSPSPTVNVGRAGLDELLQFTPLRALDSEAQLELLLSARLESVADQDVLFHFHDSDTCEYFLLSGQVRLVAADGRIHRVEAGTAIAQQPLARLRPRQFTGVVEEAAALLVVDRQLLARLQEQMRLRQQTRYGVEELEGCELGAESEELLLFRAFREDLREYRIRLPELPPTVAEIRRLSRMGSSDSTEFARIVSGVPALERYLIHAANNPLFNPKEPCSHCVTAIERLGVERLSELMLAFTPSLMQARFGAEWEPGWLQSLGVAAAGWWLAERTGLVEPYQALVLGLLHNAGMATATHYLQTQTVMELSVEERSTLLPLLCRDITRLLFALWDVDEMYAQALPVLYDWQLAGQMTRPELADLLQAARYLQLLGEHDAVLPVHDHVAGLVRTALYEQRLLNPRATRPDIAKVTTSLQRIFQL